VFDEVLGLPVHALVVHFAVVLTPLLVAVALAHALVPRWRPATAWAVVALSLGSFGAVVAAWASGPRLLESRFSTAEGVLAERIDTHASFATPLLLAVAGLSAVSLALVHAARGDRFGRTGTMVLSGLTVVLALAAAYYVFRSGDSGARAVWG